MNLDYPNLSNRGLNTPSRKLSKKVKEIENLYKEAISEQLRIKLETISIIEEMIDFTHHGFSEAIENNDIISSNKNPSSFKFKNPYSFKRLMCETRLKQSAVLRLRLEGRENSSDLDIKNLEVKYEDLIDLDSSPVNFCTSYYGQINTDAPPVTINPSLLFPLINNNRSKNGDWLEVKSKLLPFMKKYSHLYADLLAELFSIEVECERMADYHEGEEHMNWLMSEFGEDIFPD